jgi:hypothetical protein
VGAGSNRSGSGKTKTNFVFIQVVVIIVLVFCDYDGALQIKSYSCRAHVAWSRRHYLTLVEIAWKYLDAT